MFFLLHEHLALQIAGLFLSALRQVPARTVGQFQDSIGKGLTCTGIDHDIAHLILWHDLSHHTHTGDIIQGSRCLHARAGTLQQINARSQAVEHYGVFKLLLFGMLAKGHGARMVGHFGHTCLDTGKIFRLIDIQLGITFQFGAVHMQGQRGDVAQVEEFHRLCLIRHDYLL